MARLTMMDTKAAIEAGRNDASNLIAELCNDSATSPEQLFMESLAEIIGLAIECRSSEASARLSGYAEMIAPMLADACDVDPEQDEVSFLKERINALEAKCSLYGASLNNADREMIEINRQKMAAQDVVDTAVLLKHAIDQGRIKLVGTDDLAGVVGAQLKREVLALEPRHSDSEGGEL